LRALAKAPGAVFRVPWILIPADRGVRDPRSVGLGPDPLFYPNQTGRWVV
jgi:hypothetical protein